jgi:spermidine synthase
LIPFVGSTRTLYIIAGSLILLSLVLAPFALRASSFGVLALFAVSILGSEAATFYARRSMGIRDIDTQYSRVRIFPGTEAKTGRPIRAMATDPHFVQSVIYLDGQDLYAKYTRFYHLVRHFRPDFQTSLMIGGAGYTFPRNYLLAYPHASIDVVEIDPAMTELAREHFGLVDDQRLSVIHEDGRVFLNRAPASAYDAVFIDAFGSLFSVPYQLTTVEAVREIGRVLDERGVVIFNVGSAIQGDLNRFLEAEIAAYRTVFRTVYLFKVNPDYSDEQTQNVMIVACKTECSGDRPAGDEEIARMLRQIYTGEIWVDTPVLTDDLAPVEYYNSFGQNSQGR